MNGSAKKVADSVLGRLAVLVVSVAGVPAAGFIAWMVWGQLQDNASDIRGIDKTVVEIQTTQAIRLERIDEDLDDLDERVDAIEQAQWGFE